MEVKRRRLGARFPTRLLPVPVRHRSHPARGMGRLAASAIEPVNPRLPIAPQIYERLRRAITTLVVLPSEALSEKELSLQLGVSRTSGARGADPPRRRRAGRHPAPARQLRCADPAARCRGSPVHS